MATGTTPLKGDPAWLLKDMARYLATAAVLVDMVAVTRCKVAMVALQALVDILQTVKPGTTAATRVDILVYSDMTA